MKKRGANSRGKRQRRPTRSRHELPPGTLKRLRKTLKKQCQRYCKKLRRCQNDLSEKTVHALRVETRRLLSTTDLLQEFLRHQDIKCIQQALKNALNIFDDLRDSQVQLLAIGKMRRNFPAARSFHSFLCHAQDHAMSRARKDILKVRPRRLCDLVHDARMRVKRRSKDFSDTKASRMLLMAADRAFAKTKHLRRLIDPKRPETIHRTRVAFKRFRYMFETLCRHSPSLDKKLLPAMQHYQTMMGDVQDAVILLAALDKFLDEKKIKSEGAARLRDELARRKQWLIRAYLDRADELKEFWS